MNLLQEFVVHASNILLLMSMYIIITCLLDNVVKL